MGYMVSENINKMPRMKPYVVVKDDSSIKYIKIECRKALKSMPAAYNELLERISDLTDINEVKKNSFRICYIFRC